MPHAGCATTVGGGLVEIAGEVVAFVVAFDIALEPVVDDEAIAADADGSGATADDEVNGENGTGTTDSGVDDHTGGICGTDSSGD